MTAAIYVERGLQTPRPTDCELVELDTQLVPMLLSAIAGRIGPSHWESEAAYHVGYDRLSRQGAALMLGCKEDIIVEIRAARDAEAGHADYSTTVNPVGMFPGASLASLVNQQNSQGLTTAELLVQIRDNIAASGQASEDQLELLGQLVLLMGV
jgi:hypothetical protein